MFVSLFVSFLKIAATCGIRKILDFLFTQEELFWLDDILPGKKKSEIIKNVKNEENFLKSLIDERYDQIAFNSNNVINSTLNLLVYKQLVYFLTIK